MARRMDEGWGIPAISAMSHVIRYFWVMILGNYKMLYIYSDLKLWIALRENGRRGLCPVLVTICCCSFVFFYFTIARRGVLINSCKIPGGHVLYDDKSFNSPHVLIEILNNLPHLLSGLFFYCIVVYLRFTNEIESNGLGKRIAMVDL